MTKTIVDLLEAAFSKNRNKLALVSENGQEVTFGAFHDYVQAFTENLKLGGVKSGDYVAPAIDNYAVNLMLRIACIYAGAATLITLNPNPAIAKGVPVKWVVAMASGNKAPTKGQIRFDTSWLRKPYARCIPAKTFSVISGSSGTTGVPKYMELDAQSYSNRALRATEGRPSVDGTTLIAYGSTAGGGLSLPIRALIAGQTIVRPASTAQKTIARIQKYKVSYAMIPTQYLPILSDAAEKSGARMRSIRSIWAGGGSLSRTYAKRFEHIFNCQVYNSYGSSEIGGIAYARPSQFDVELGLVGRLASEVTVKFLDTTGQEVSPLGGGEIRVRIPENCRITKSFGFDLPYDTDGFCAPGDVGYMRSDGNLVITGRTKEIINAGGNKIAPSAMETFALGFGSIKQAVAFGVTNALGSEDVGLALVISDGFDKVKFDEFVVAKYGKKFSVRAFIVAEIPVGNSQKIDREQLRDMLKECE